MEAWTRGYIVGKARRVTRGGLGPLCASYNVSARRIKVLSMFLEVLLVLQCLSSMGFPILRGVPQGSALVVLDGSIVRVILPFRNILQVYRKNVPMIIQSLGSTGYISLFFSSIAHSITLLVLLTPRPSVNHVVVAVVVYTVVVVVQQLL